VKRTGDDSFSFLSSHRRSDLSVRPRHADTKEQQQPVEVSSTSWLSSNRVARQFYFNPFPQFYQAQQPPQRPANNQQGFLGGLFSSLFPSARPESGPACFTFNGAQGACVDNARSCPGINVRDYILNAAGGLRQGLINTCVLIFDDGTTVYAQHLPPATGLTLHMTRN
jgi:hypothetical protein